MNIEPGGERNLWWVLAALVLSAVVLFGVRDLITLKAAPIWDATDYYAPAFCLVADHAKAARLLLWDPWLDGGLTDFAEPQVGASSPVVLLIGLLSHNPFHGFVFYWIAEWIFGGVGMLLLCRHLRAPLWGALAVSAGFLACGIYTGHAEHTSITYSFSFLPWILWRLDAALLGRDWRAAVQAGLLWGLSALGGYPQLVILDVMFLGLWSLGTSCFNRNVPSSSASGTRFARLGRAVVMLALLGFVGTLILAPSYYAFLVETRGLTSRVHGIDKAWAMSNNLPPAAFSSLSSPYLYLLNLPPHRLWPETDVSMSNIYCGAITLLLAGFSLINATRWRIWLALVAIFFFACSVGQHLPLRGWLYDFLPPTRYFRNPSLFAPYAMMTLFVLAAYGARDAAKVWSVAKRQLIVRMALVSIVACAVVLSSYYYTLQKAGLSVKDAELPSIQLGIVWIALLSLLLLAILDRVNGKVLMCGLLAVALFDAALTLDISKPSMFSPAAVPWWNQMMKHHDPSLDLTSRGLQRSLHPPESLGTYPNNRSLAIKEATFFNDTGLINKFFERIAYEPAVNKFATGAQRMWFSETSSFVPASDQNFNTFVEIARRQDAPVLLIHNREQVMNESITTSDQSWSTAARGMLQATVDLKRYGPNTLSLRFDAPTDGWLLVTDRWAPGWSATVNGRAVEVLPADFIFRAVKVSTGLNDITFQYRSRAYIWLVALSWLTMLACVAILGYGLLQRRYR